MSHRHRISLNETNEIIENDAETKQNIESKKVVVKNYEPVPFFREINEENASVSITRGSNEDVYMIHFNASNGYKYFASGGLSQCCDQMINELLYFVEKEQKIIEDSKRIIDKFAEMMVGNGEIADDVEAFEHGFLLMNEVIKEENNERDNS